MACKATFALLGWRILPTSCPARADGALPEVVEPPWEGFHLGLLQMGYIV